MYKINDLVYLMARLRDEKTGCPWDLKQNFESIVPYTVEEMYEVVDAIDHQDMENLSEELGDLLFQIVFYAQLGKESQAFDFSDIVDGVTSKLIRRHPHVFPDGTLESIRQAGTSINASDVSAQWDKIKKQERKPREKNRLLDSVPSALPSITRALKLQKVASNVGFDWNDVTLVMDKIVEELDEVRDALKSGSKDAIEDEVGDVLFAAVNLARLSRVDPETALRRTNRKFYHRFNYVEAQLALQSISLQEASLEMMNELWEEAKRKV